MDRLEEINIAVPPDMAEEMRAVVKSGEYASTGEVVREALTEWHLRRLERDQAREEFGRLWDIGLASGPSVDGEEAFAAMRKRLEAKIGKRLD